MLPPFTFTVLDRPGGDYIIGPRNVLPGTLHRPNANLWLVYRLTRKHEFERAFAVRR